ncbi:2-oxoglutarate dehydrogenase E1 component [Herbaspirillum sp. NPDC087042]|uniref:2-oxoglutarate dehydrogenase E1 component n=1 Tax=Herbaspirillum sp. NPDC087042 TaxID=3364004 RepID=UPI003813C51A
MSFQHPTSVAGHAGVRQSLAHARVQAFIDAYKREGYRIADIDPLDSISVPDIAELQPQYHALCDEDVVLSQHRFLDGLGLTSVRDLAHHLGKLYSGPLGVDCSGIRDDSRGQWLLARLAAPDHGAELAGHERAALLTRLVAAEEWERFLQEEYPLGKRFSLEGCESLLLLMESLAERASFYQLEKLFFAMPHRGRLNLLVNFMQMPAAEIVAYFDKQKTTPAAAGAVDLPYHLGHQSVRPTAHGQIALLLAHNPSHLESAYPVLLGMVRGAQAQDIHGQVPASVVIHGDAAFCGQGVVMESLKLAQHPGYTVGGTVHVIVNNQIGFTTPNPLDPENHGYCTDIARVVGAPVLHVNADQPEMVLRAARIAFDYRMQFQSDVVIDLVGYRRWGHSEQDTSTFTQPLLHGFIEKHPTVTARYEQAAQPGMADGWPGLARARLEARARFQADVVENGAAHAQPVVQPAPVLRENPGLAELRHFVERMTTLPEGFAAHAAIGKLITQWQASVTTPQAVCQWTFAENMAYASLLSQGQAVRISGMDVQRGTFLHRHAVWHAVDAEQGVQREFWPLREVTVDGAALEIINSPLSEEAVVGFEYGFSSQVHGPGLVIWEAQFGDFVNGAQIMIDQYITSGTGKWGYRSGLTMLLPHGYEGVGPEHSTGYLSRMLLLCAQNNIRVAMPSTSAQWFHLLRQQALEGAQPLVVFTPKVVLHGEAGSHSPLSALIEGGFAPFLGDRLALPAAQVRRVVLCSGKVYYDLARGQAEAGDDVTAILSVEQLYPFPAASLGQVLEGYPALEEVIWVQEEERSQGAWLCVREDIEASLPATVRLRAVCRDNTASGPTASKSVHHARQMQLVQEVFPATPVTTQA